MSYYLAEIRFNKNKSKNSEKKEKKRKRLIHSLVTLTLISLLISAPTMLFSVTVNAAEPSLPSILNNLGFTNIDLTSTETFSPGMYNITLYAEFAGYHSQNELSYYAVGTSDFQTIFAGPEGATGSLGGYIDPPISKIITVGSQFGLSMLAPEHRYFTETYLNPDSPPEQHAQVYRNLDVPGVFLIGFENKFGGGDRDYNDMVFSLVPLYPPEIVSVTRTPETPNYDQSVRITAQVIKGSADIDSVILKYQIDSGSWVSVTMNLEGGLYVADIPAQPYNTAVNYRVYAYDTIGNYDVSGLFSYTVGDFVPPVISNVVHVPNPPYPYQPVTVSAKVTEPADASGVKNVTLWYTETGTWTFTTMTLHEGLWTADIPGQGGGLQVNFFVEAFDNAENNAKTSIFSYTVIIPNIPPIAAFTKSASIVYTGEVIDFDASASYDIDGYIFSYSWEFGDGNTGSGVTASHSYVDDGEYIVSLRVVDNHGAFSIKKDSIVVKNRPPIADLDTSSAILDKKEIVTFDASGSYDPDGYIVSYSWDFGDGNTATGVTASHLYPASGTYTVTLTVIDDDGATDSITVTKTVRNRSPVADFTESAHTVYTSESINFDASGSYDPDGTIVSYSWDFGDGNTATGVTASHAYADNGSYVVNLTVTDNDGATDSAHATKTVINRPPVADFTESAHTVDTGESINFDASGSHDPDGTIVSYSWNFGDGNSATGVTASHSYATSGTYTVILTVTDDDGATDSITATKTVKNRPPVADFTESAHTVSTGENIAFDASGSYDPDGTIVDYSWDFGDGTEGSGVSVQHAYSQVGTYTVTLTVTDNDGATDTAEATKTILNRSPVASFTESAHTVYTSESINFDASGSHDSDGTIVSYSWDFGDGNTATGVEVDHAYEDDGVYNVTLTVVDDDDATGSATETKNVLNRPPIANFTESAHTVDAGESIDFDASGSSDPDGTIVSYSWDFGDGNTATGVTVDHAYSEDGNYTVTLTVTDDDGAYASSVATKIVETGTGIDTTISLAMLSVIGLGVTALTATFLYAFYVRRKKKKKNLGNA
jgi:PKD repeat protein